MGTRYVVELRLDGKQWYLILEMDGTVEDKIPLHKLTESALKNAVYDLMSRINHPMNDFQIHKVYIDLLKSTKHIFIKNHFQPQEPRGRSPTELSQASSTSSDPDEIRGQSYQLQQRLVSEYREKLNPAKSPPVEKIEIKQLPDKSDDTELLEALIESHQEVQQMLRNLDARVATLENLVDRLTDTSKVSIPSD